MAQLSRINTILIKHFCRKFENLKKANQKIQNCKSGHLTSTYTTCKKFSLTIQNLIPRKNFNLPIKIRWRRRRDHGEP
jgi:hypothetical protein